MPKIPQKVDSDRFLCYNIGIRKGGNYSYFARKIKIFFSNLYFRLFNYFYMTLTATSASDYFADYFLTWKKTIEFTTLSENTIKRAIKDGAFPKPVPLFKRRVGFRKSDLILWAEGKRDW